MSKLEEMLRIARAATRGPWENETYDVRAPGRLLARCEITVRGRSYDETFDEAVANAQHIATFNPRTAEALVKVALAAKKMNLYADWSVLIEPGDPITYDDPSGINEAQVEMCDALSALTAAMEDSSNVG